jgi:peptide/nickel transport system permease protein
MSRLLQPILRITLTVLAGGMLSATLARYAPGFGSDEDQLDTRRDSASLQRLRNRQMEDANVTAFYTHSLIKYLQGDLGVSRSLQRPVRELLADRFKPTIIALLTGLALAWMLGLSAALLAIFRPNPLAQAGLAAGATLLQCVPAAVVALFLFVLGGRGPLLGGVAVALVLYPRIASYSSGLLKQAYNSSHVLMARSRGLSQTRVLLWHALPVSFPQLISFAGVSVSLALSACIPMEVILDTPGIGQLAWQAALARDMSLLVALTICFSLVIVSANTISEILISRTAPGKTS